MAINVNTVYTTVLSILNKEQRGYLTPYEFNQLATQVQLDIFEKFFEDYNQYIRMPKTDVEFASRMDHIREEFQVFEKTEMASAVSGTNEYTQPTDLHRFGTANYIKGLNTPEIEIVSNRDYTQQILSPLTQPSTNFPIAKYKENKLTVSPAVESISAKDVLFNYIRKPKDVRWGYTVGGLGQYVYDSTLPSSLKSAASLNASITQAGIGGTPGPYTYAPAISSGGGTGGEITITIGPGGDVTNAVVSAADIGYGYSVGDTITFSGGGLTLDAIITLQSADLTAQTTNYSVDFEISDAQQSEVILEILKYAGVIIRDPQIVNGAASELAKNEANTKR